MPFGKWRSFEDCVKDFVSKGKTEESAKRICGALKARLEREGAGGIFSWEGEITPQQGNLINGKAIHPIKTCHPEEWPSIRVYLEEELLKAANSLIGAPLLLDHTYLLDGEVIEASYRDGAIEYVAELRDEQILDWIRRGAIKHCSVEYDWGSLDKVNGVAPRHIQFTGLALLKDFEPGDPESSVEIWNRIVEKIKETESMTQLSSSSVQGSEIKNERINGPEDDGHVSKLEKTVEGLRIKIAALTNQKEILEEAVKRAEERSKLLEEEDAELRSRLREAVIDPSADNIKDPISRKKVAEMLEAVIPPNQVVFSHGQTGGFRRLVDDVRRVIRKIEEAEA